MGKRGLHSFTNSATLEAFDEVSLWEILHQHKEYCAQHGLMLADQPQEDLDRRQVANLLQADADLPRQLLDAFLTIGDVAVPSRLPALVKLGQTLGLAPEDLIGDDITPVMVAARIWRKDAAALKRLTEQSQIESGHAYRTWRAASDEIPAYTPIHEASLRRWEKHVAGEFFKRGLGDGARIFVHTVDDYVFFLVRHGCSPRRDITHEKGADTGNVLYRPSRTDILRYDTLTGELAIYQRERRKWQEELYLAACSLHAFGQPHLFTGDDAYDLAPLPAKGAAILDCEGIEGIRKVVLVAMSVSSPSNKRLSIHYAATDLFAAMRTAGIAWRDLPPCVEVTFLVTFTTGLARKVTVRPPNVVRCSQHGDEVLVQQWLLRHGIKKALVRVDDQPDF
jgi:hypothetical protein